MGTFKIQTDSMPPCRNHWKLSPRSSGTARLNDAAVRVLREKVVPDFMRASGLSDLTREGFRMIVDMPDRALPPIIHLFAGKSVPNFNPQDWRTPNSTTWDPNGHAPFFELSAAAALQGLEKMQYGYEIFNIDGANKVFGVADGDPKAETHFLMLTTDKFGTMADPTFTTDYWIKYFDGAEQILAQLGISNQPARFVSNFGRLFQQSPRVHMHVFSAKDGLFHFFPQDYGFLIQEDGTIKAPEGSKALSDIVNLAEKRSKITGFDAEAIQAKKSVDAQLFAAIRALSFSV